MAHFDSESQQVVGEHGALEVPEGDEIIAKLMMLIEGECEGLGPKKAAEKYGFSKQRYFQLRTALAQSGSGALLSKKRGPKTNYRRTDEVVRQIIRYRFLDPYCSPEVITQKLIQNGFTISQRSVLRVIEDFGLQKKTLQVSAKDRRRRAR